MVLKLHSRKLIPYVLMLLGLVAGTYVSAQQFNWAVGTGGGDGFGKQMLSRPRFYGGHFTGTDRSGNVYITGCFNGTQDFDPGPATFTMTPKSEDFGVYLSKFDAKGVHLWSKCIISGREEDKDWYNRPFDIAVDNLGRVTVIGWFSETIVFDKGSSLDSVATEKHVNNSFSPGVYIIQYDAQGTYQWMKAVLPTFPTKLQSKYKTENPRIVLSGGMSTDGMGNIYMSGYATGSFDFDPGAPVVELSGFVPDRNPQSTFAFVAKYKADGTYVWAKEFIIDTTIQRTGYFIPGTVVVDTLNGVNNIFLSGTLYGAIDFEPGSGKASLQSLANGGGDAALIKLNGNGQYQWGKVIGGSGNEEYCQIAYSKYGNIYMVGRTASADVDFDPGSGTIIPLPGGPADLFIAKYDNEGNYLWANRVGGSGVFLDVAKLAVDHLEHLYVEPRFFSIFDSSGINFNPGGDSVLVFTELSFIPGSFPPSGLEALAQYDPCGSLLWTGKINGANSDNFNIDGIVVHASSVDTSILYLSGHITNKMYWAYNKPTPDYDLGQDVFRIPSEENMPPEQDVLMKLTFDFDVPRLDIRHCGDTYIIGDSVYNAAHNGQFIHRQQKANGCDSFIAVNLNLFPIIPPVITVDSMLLGVLGSYVGYQWLLDGELLPGATDSVYRALENGEYTVIVTNEGGCIDTSEVYTVSNVGIEDWRVHAEQITIYPNPATGQIYINAGMPVNIRLTDLAGREMKNADKTKAISVQDLSPGIYIVEVRSQAGRLLKSEKLVKH